MNKRLIIPTIKPQIVLQTMSEVYDWGLQDLHIPEIHKQNMGEDVNIGVIDSGKSTHFDIKNNTLGSKNFTEDKYVEDRQGHSTFVSGIIAAEKNNQGVVGTAPQSKVYFAKAISDSGSGDPMAMTKAIYWCIDKRVDIISISAGMFHHFKPIHKAIKAAYRANIIVIAAAGNDGKRHEDVAYPARYAEVIAVAAYDKNHKVASFSSRGANVSFALPGVNIYSTWLDNQYTRSSGTSFACPVLSGICALILSTHKKGTPKTPCETPQQMMEHLVKYSVKLGKKTETGFGMINTKQMFKDGVGH